MNWSLYIVRTGDNKLYTGISTDPQRRLVQHQQGKGAKALRGKGPLSLVYQSAVGEHSTALRLEYSVKQLSRQQKELLIIGQRELPQLAD